MPFIYTQKPFHETHRTAICRALFDAAEKTQAGSRMKETAKQTGLSDLSNLLLGHVQKAPSVAGVWSALGDHEIDAALRAARDGYLEKLGYLPVKLKFTLDGVETTEFEKMYGISALTILKAAGIDGCGDTPFTTTRPSAYGGFGYAGGSGAATKLDSKTISLPKKDILLDKRFKKSSKEGVLFESCSCSLISDEDLGALGVAKWTRRIEGIDNIILVLEMSHNSHSIQQSPRR